MSIRAGEDISADKRSRQPDLRSNVRLSQKRGIYTKLDFEMDTPYYGSAYFDGEMLYYSAYRSSDDRVTLMGIDVAGGSKACYELGVFDEGVKPVAGLMELGQIENHIGLILDSQNSQEISAPNVVKEKAEPKSGRMPQAVDSPADEAAPESLGAVREELVHVDVTLPGEGSNADLTVSFDPSMMTLIGVGGNSAAFAWKAEEGRIRMSLAEADLISGGEPVNSAVLNALDPTGAAANKATKLFELLKLGSQVRVKSDHRVLKRNEAYQMALDSLADWKSGRNPAMVRQIVRTVQNGGFFSVWMTVFADEPDILLALIHAFPGTEAAFYDAEGHPKMLLTKPVPATPV